MKRENEMKLLYGSILIGLLLSPTILRKDRLKFWSALYLMNAVSNHLIDRALIKFNFLKYPVRIFPKLFKVNVVYDYFICPYFSVWFSQATQKTGLLKTLVRLAIITSPQIALEIWAERKTNLLHFRNWTFLRTATAIVSVKLVSKLYEKILNETLLRGSSIKKTSAERYSKNATRHSEEDAVDPV